MLKIFSLIFSTFLLFFLFSTGCENPKNIKNTQSLSNKNVTAEQLSLTSTSKNKAIDFSLPFHAKDGDFRLTDAIKDKTVVLLFFSTSCSHCKDELTELKNIIGDYKNIRFIAVDGGDSENSITRFLSNIGIDIECIVDKTGKIFKDYKVYGIPTTYIIGKDGNIADHWIGKKSLKVTKAIFSKY